MNLIAKTFITTLALVSISINSYALTKNTYPNQIKIFSESKTDKKLNYEIKLDYPQLLNLQNMAIKNKINNDFKKYIKKNKDDFLKNVMDSYNPTQSFEVGNNLGIYYETYYMDKNKLSCLFSSSTYYVGAAHSNNEMTSLNYDLKTGNQIKLKELFKDKSNYLKVLSDYSINSLKTKVAGYNDGSSWLKEGASPKDDNFDTFVIGKDHLIIHFQSYQVASFAEGPQEVKIPFSKLKGILK